MRESCGAATRRLFAHQSASKLSRKQEIKQESGTPCGPGLYCGVSVVFASFHLPKRAMCIHCVAFALSLTSVRSSEVSKLFIPNNDRTIKGNLITIVLPTCKPCGNASKSGITWKCIHYRYQCHGLSNGLRASCLSKFGLSAAHIGISRVRGPPTIQVHGRWDST